MTIRRNKRKLQKDISCLRFDCIINGIGEFTNLSPLAFIILIRRAYSAELSSIRITAVKEIKNGKTQNV